MAYGSIYTRINWQDYPNKSTALKAALLNRMDGAVKTLDDRAVELDSVKADKTIVNGMVKDWTMDRTTGIITITRQNGEKILFDLNIEKIPVSFGLSESGILTMTTDDGTKFTADIGAMIPVLTFNSSDEIGVNAEGTGVTKTYSFFIKSGSITGDKLEPDYLAKAQTAMTTAQTGAQTAAEKTELAKTYCTNAGVSADRAEQALSQITEAVDANVPDFTINLATGHMEYTGGRYVFKTNTDTGHLEWEVAV